MNERLEISFHIYCADLASARDTPESHKALMGRCLARADALIEAEAQSRKDEHQHAWSAWKFDDPKFSKTRLQRLCKTCAAVEYGTLAEENK